VPVRLSAQQRAVHSIVLPLPGFQAIALFRRHTLTVVLVAFGVMFLVALAAFLLNIFTLPSDRNGVK